MKIDELRAALQAGNQGWPPLKRKHETDCVEELCSEIDGLRAELAEAKRYAGCLEEYCDEYALKRAQADAAKENA